MSTQIYSTDVISHLKNGVTRKITDKHYNAEIGSIQEKYNLSPSEVDRLFKSPLLKNIRVRPHVEETFVLIEGSSNTEEETVEVTETISEELIDQEINNDIEEEIDVSWDTTVVETIPNTNVLDSLA